MAVFLHHSHAEVPTSTKVKEGLITSGQNLDKIKKKLKNYEASTEKKFEVIQEIQKDLEEIIKLYNVNVGRIQTGCNLIKIFEYPTFEQMVEDNPVFQGQWPKMTSDSTCAGYVKQLFKPNYDKERAEAENHYLKNLDNNYNLAQSTPFQLSLKEKIEKVIQRASAQKLPIEQLPKLEELAEYNGKMKEWVEAVLRHSKLKLTAVDAADPLKSS